MLHRVEGCRGKSRMIKIISGSFYAGPAKVPGTLYLAAYTILNLYRMYPGDSKGISYTSGFFILIGLWVGGLIAGSVLAIPIWLMLGSGSLLDMGEKMLSPEYVNAARVIQVITTAFVFFLPAYVTAQIINKKPAAFLGFNTHFTANQLVVSCALIFLGAVVASSSAQIMEAIPLPAGLESRFRAMEDSYAAQVESIAAQKSF